ncbi:unnamed protein product, partial [Darwinula stevensoni]
MEFGRCRLSIAVPRGFNYQSVQDLQGKSIATSYPKILQQYLDKHNIQADIHVISGSVEIATGIGLADAICDIVSTGSTLLSNGLKEVEQIFHSEAILIANKNLSQDKKLILDDLLFRLNAVKKAKKNKYILLNVPNANIDNVVKILPGIKSPTILPLAQVGWSSLHSVIPEKDFWQIIQQLKDAERPSQSLSDIVPIVQPIINDVYNNGDDALKHFSIQFDKIELQEFKVSDAEIIAASANIDSNLKEAIEVAYNNIYTFHSHQKSDIQQIQTTK